MPASIFIARLLGPLIAIVGLALLANAEVFRAVLKEFIHSPALSYLAGFFGLLGGIALILVHNLWVPDWRIVITLLGWLTIVRGVVTVFRPQWISAVGKRLLESRGYFTGAAIVNVLLGLFLCGCGYLNA